ncbi:MAG: pyridoxamine 5'-phosphate oxidase [Saprospiraceae bacterium]|nr:pyridoxamine 5'-phosphate oxidase [Saprospiraceae bacterium]
MLENIESESLINSSLDKSDLDSNPFKQFDTWYKNATASNEIMPNGMSLATVSKNLQPSLRTVLLKYYDEEGFVFFTNYNSRKSKEITQNPHVAIKFYWSSLGRQLIILGKAEKISTLQSVKYFMSRPAGSRIGAWCSNQSEVIQSRSDLLDSFKAIKDRFQNMEIPKPQHWGGYRIVPSSFEFWQDGKFRLHDRFLYSLDEKKAWNLDRLAP